MLPIPVFRVEKNANYTTMSNYHLRDSTISFKAKGILSMFLSLPKNWNYSVSGLAAISKEGKDGILSGLKELEAAGYLERHRYRNERGRLGDSEYVIYEIPPHRRPVPATPEQGLPKLENGLILGTPGSGKSFSAKREITNAFLTTSDDIIVCDPEAEYAALVTRLKGQVINCFRCLPTSKPYHCC